MRIFSVFTNSEMKLVMLFVNKSVNLFIAFGISVIEYARDVMKVSVENTVKNFDSTSKILNIEYNSLVNKDRMKYCIKRKYILFLEIILEGFSWCYLSLTHNFCISIQIDKARTFDDNERIGIVLQSAIHEEVSLIDYRSWHIVLLNVIVMKETRPVYNHALAKSRVFENGVRDIHFSASVSPINFKIFIVIICFVI